MSQIITDGIPKKHKLLDLFSDDTSYHISDVLEYTGIVSIGSLKSTLSELRKKGIANIRIKFNFVRRIDASSRTN